MDTSSADVSTSAQTQFPDDLTLRKQTRFVLRWELEDRKPGAKLLNLEILEELKKELFPEADDIETQLDWFREKARNLSRITGEDRIVIGRLRNQSVIEYRIRQKLNGYGGRKLEIREELVLLDKVPDWDGAMHMVIGY